MDLDPSELRRVPEGGTLAQLDSGIEIVRRKKHEPVELEGLSPERLAEVTGKRMGSKFLPEISLARIIEMTASLLDKNGAVRGGRPEYNKVFEEPIGISGGKRVRGLRVRLHGRYAHAYPVDETGL